MSIWRTVIVKQGMPTIEEARNRLRQELQHARRDNVKLLRIVHGYGSSGVGGDLRIALQATLRQMAQHGEIRACIFGEHWRTSDESTWEILKRLPALKNDPELGKGNKGFTMVVL